jgi:hypothetical protein
MPEVLAAPSAADAASEAAALGGSRGASPFNTGKNLEASFGNLEKFAKPPSTEATTIPPHPAQKKTEPAKAPEKPVKDSIEDAKDDAPPAKPNEPSAKDETLDPAKPVVDPTKPKKPADFLREKLAKTEQERDSFKAELEKVKTATPTEHPEVKTLTEQVESLRKEKAKLEEEFRYVDYEKSPEYKEKFWQPYEDAWNRGRQMMGRLKATDTEGNVRAATPEDFDGLMKDYLNDPEAAATRLENMFGPRASLITPHMLEVEKAGVASRNAISEFRKTGSEREKQRSETFSRVEKEITDHWTAATKPETVPDQWKPYVLPKGTDKDGNPIDKEGDAILEKGLAEFDRAASENARNPQLTKEQRQAVLGRAAAIRNKAASFGRLVRDIRAKDTRIAELEKELKDFQASEPGAGEGEREAKGKGASAETMEGALTALDKRATPKYY